MREAIAMATTVTQIPQDIIDALEGDGELTDDQLCRLITAEAAMLGLTFDEAVSGARAKTLPKNYLGSGIEFLVRMLDYVPPAAE